MAAGHEVVVLDGATDLPLKYPRALGRQPLATINQVREELNRVYRAVCAGKISVKAGTSLTYILRETVKTLEVEKIEPALEMLTREREQRPGG